MLSLLKLMLENRNELQAEVRNKKSMTNKKRPNSERIKNRERERRK